METPSLFRGRLRQPRLVEGGGSDHENPAQAQEARGFQAGGGESDNQLPAHPQNTRGVKTEV